MSRVIKLAIRIHMKGKLMHVHFTYIMTVPPHRDACTQFCKIISWAYSVQEIWGVKTGRIHPDELGNNEYHMVGHLGKMYF